MYITIEYVLPIIIVIVLYIYIYIFYLYILYTPPSCSSLASVSNLGLQNKLIKGLQNGPQISNLITKQLGPRHTVDGQNPANHQG